MSESTDPMVAALLRERDGYVKRGLPDRVAQVDAELARRGYVGPAVVADPESTPPRGRRSPGPKQTASNGD
jgi:hypothetical protein